MRVRFLLLFVSVFIVSMVTAQPGSLTVMGVSPDMYLLHTVAPKENWYSVGRLYNISPKEVAPFNSLTIDKPLSIGQEIKIPLTTTNFSQDGTMANDEVSVPVYHIIQEKEWMYRVSTNYNKVPIESLEKWNGITKDQAKTGMKIIIGYLKVKTDQSALASKGTTNIKTAVVKKASSPVATDAAPSVNTAAANTPPANTPPVNTSSVNTSSANTPPVNTVPVNVPEKKVDPPVDKQEVKENKQVLAPAEEKQVVTNNPASQPSINTNTVSSGGAGYFKSLFEANGKSVSGAAGIFKSTSGWQDGKYYALMNNVAVGTIVKVINPTNNKIVYAKVLGQLPDMKESVGLTARISDAAASELGATVMRFSVEVKY